MLGLVFVPRRQWAAGYSGGRAKLVFLILFAMVLLTGLVGCQGLQNGSKDPLTPRGVYTVTVTAASTNVSHSTAITLTVQ
jgi:hypothetical protein